MRREADPVSGMVEEIQRFLDDGKRLITAQVSLVELDAVLGSLVGRRSRFVELRKRIGGLPAESRKEVGRLLNAAVEELEQLGELRRGELSVEERERGYERERLDLTETEPTSSRGHGHVVTSTHETLEDVFVGMGFSVAEGPEIESDWYNFEALNIPPDHPARSMWDTLYVNLEPQGKMLLRTHTSPVQIRVMQAQRPPIRVICPGRVYRRDTADASHMPVFHQIEGLVVDRGISFADLAGTLEAFTTEYFGKAIHSRLRPSYFPFTEPSAEFDINCLICEGAGCRTCGMTGWLELGGCGMVHPNVFAAVGLDPEEWTGFAFGFGTERLALMRYGIDDMRELWTCDVRFLRQF
ncbi:MAG: phenylalanine--tRNA ligase alpha subunit [Acidimicrobiales bacterium]|nr:MAG: phenylalanine--tRNA ligase alpha subunit [Acidimicrobiales bacterium]